MGLTSLLETEIGASINLMSVAAVLDRYFAIRKGKTMANNIRRSSEGKLDNLSFSSSITAFLFKSATGWATLLLVAALSIFLFGIPLLFLAWKALEYKMTHYELGESRLFIRQGVINRSEEEIELFRVKDVRADFSVIQQQFGVGDLQIISSDATGSMSGRRSNFRIPNVEDARSIRELMRERVDKAREAKGVREFDAV